MHRGGIGKSYSQLATAKGGSGKSDEITPNEMLGQKVGTEFYAID
jgi:hypothetical protein